MNEAMHPLLILSIPGLKALTANTGEKMQSSPFVKSRSIAAREKEKNLKKNF